VGCLPGGGPLRHHDDIARQNCDSWCVPADGARGIDTDIILPLGEVARRWGPEWENDYFGCFHATHSTSGDG